MTHYFRNSFTVRYLARVLFTPILLTIGINAFSQTQSDEEILLNRIDSLESVDRTQDVIETLTADYFKMGNIRKNENAYEEAVNFYSKSVEVINEMPTQEDAEIITEAPSQDVQVKAFRGIVLRNLSMSYSAIEKVLESDSTIQLAIRDLEDVLEEVNHPGYKRILASMYMEASNAKILLNDYNSTRDIIKRGIALFEEIDGFDGKSYVPHISYLRSNLAVAEYDLGNYHAAITMNKDILSSMEDTPERERSTYYYNISTTVRHRLSMACSAIYHDDESINSYKEAIGMEEELYNKDPSGFPIGLASSLNNLGVNYEEIFEFTLAAKTYQKALDIKLKFNENNPDFLQLEIAFTSSNLGNVYSKNNNLDSARALYDTYVPICTRIIQENGNVRSRDLAEVYNETHLLYLKEKEFDKAKKNLDFAREIREKNYEENHELHAFDLSKTYDNLGDLYLVMKKKGKARKFFLKSYSLKKMLSEKTPSHAADHGLALLDLGRMYMAKKKVKKALPHLNDAKEFLEEYVEVSPNRFNPPLAHTYQLLGEVHTKLRLHEEAQNYLDQSLEIRQSLNTKDSRTFAPELAETYISYALLKKKVDEEEESLSHLENARELLGVVSDIPIYADRLTYITKRINN